MKCGLKSFPLAVDLDDSVKLVEAEFGTKAFAVVIKLYQAIHSRGYYMKWDIDTELLFIRDYCLSEIGRNLVSEIVACCVRRGVFDSSLYEKYKILTSKRIQETFLNATKRSKEVIFEKEYALPIVYNFIQNASKDGKNVNISFKNVNSLQQRKEKERKENNLSYTHVRESGGIDENLKAFLEKNPQIYLDSYNANISNIDFSLLDKRISESAWLKEITSFAWLCENYLKISGGYYKTFKKKQEDNKAFANERTYTKEETSDVIDDIESIEF